MKFFNTVNIRTPESVELEFTLAGIGNRCLALLIDYLIWTLTLIGILLIWYIIALYFLEFFLDLNIQLWLTGISILILFVVYTSYFVFFETFWQGQTPGKRYAKIRVVRDNGQPVGLTQSLMRSLLRPVDDILFFGVLLIIFGRNEKRIGDWVAGTLVIQEVQTAKKAGFQISDPAQDLAIQLPAQGNVAALMPDDFAVLQEFLQRRSRMDDRARSTLARNLTEQLSQLMAMEPVPIQLPPEVFIEAVYLAYMQQP